MEIEFNKEQYGNIYNIEMSEEFIKDFEAFEAEMEKEENEFSKFLKENNISIE